MYICTTAQRQVLPYVRRVQAYKWVGVGVQVGLNYICATAERFFAVSAVLCTMVGTSFQEQPSLRLLKHIIRCYLRLSDNGRAREALRQCLPAHLTQQDFHLCLKDDIQTRQCVPASPTSVVNALLLSRPACMQSSLDFCNCFA